jgi:hypothetical protein
MARPRSIYAIRRDNLKRLIRARFANVPARIAEVLGFRSRPLIYRYLADLKPKNIGFRLARRIERIGRRPAHWLDRPQAGA